MEVCVVLYALVEICVLPEATIATTLEHVEIMKKNKN